MNRIDNLTGIRAFAACWVVLFHLQTELATSSSLGPVSNYGWLGVDVFFVLSGFVLSIVYAPRLQVFSRSWYRDFLLKRFAKIYPMHLITFLIMVVIILAGRHVHYEFRGSPDNNRWSALCNVLMIHAFGLTRKGSWNIHSWSVSAEWFAYTVLLTPILLGFRKRSVGTVLAFASALWVVFLLFCHYVLHQGADLTRNGVLRIIPEFFCGYAVYRLLPFIKVPGDLLTTLGAVCVVVVCEFPHALFWLLMPAVMLLLAGAYRRGPMTNLLFGNRVSILIGEASYSIYLTQLLVLIVINYLLRRIPIQIHGALALPVEAVAGALTLLFGTLCFLRVEEPIRQWILRSFSSSQKSREQVAESPRRPLAPDTQITSTIG